MLEVQSNAAEMQDGMEGAFDFLNEVATPETSFDEAVNGESVTEEEVVVTEDVATPVANEILLESTFEMPTFPKAVEGGKSVGINQIGYIANVRANYSDIVELATSIAYNGLKTPLTVAKVTETTPKTVPFAVVTDAGAFYSNPKKPTVIAVDGHRRFTALLFLQDVGIKVKDDAGVTHTVKLPKDFQIPVTYSNVSFSAGTLDFKLAQYEMGTKSKALTPLEVALVQANMTLATNKKGTTVSQSEVARRLSGYQAISTASLPSDTAMKKQVNRSVGLGNFLLSDTHFELKSGIVPQFSDINDVLSADAEYVIQLCGRNVVAVTGLQELSDLWRANGKGKFSVANLAEYLKGYVSLEEIAGDSYYPNQAPAIKGKVLLDWANGLITEFDKAAEAAAAANYVDDVTATTGNRYFSADPDEDEGEVVELGSERATNAMLDSVFTPTVGDIIVDKSAVIKFDNIIDRLQDACDKDNTLAVKTPKLLNYIADLIDGKVTDLKPLIRLETILDTAGFDFETDEDADEFSLPDTAIATDEDDYDDMSAEGIESKYWAE